MWLQAFWQALTFLHLERSITITNFLPGMPLLASLFVTAGRSGTGFKNALSISMTLPSTDKSFTICPEGLIWSSSGAKGLLVLHPATAAEARNPVKRNSLLDCFMFSFIVVVLFIYPML